MGTAALLVAVAIGAALPPVNEPVVTGADFRVIAMFGGAPGDSRETLERSAAAGTPDVEVNFYPTSDGTLVTAHDEEVGGTCGDVTERTLAELAGCVNSQSEHLATLTDVLAMPFKGVWIDLKAPTDCWITGDCSTDAVPAALTAIGDRPGVTLMVYEADYAEARRGTVATVLKGYPETPEAIVSLIDRAVAGDAICIEARWLTPALVAYARDRDVDVLPWVGERTDPALLRELVRSGVAGLIVSGGTDLRPVLADQAAPQRATVEAGRTW